MTPRKQRASLREKLHAILDQQMALQTRLRHEDLLPEEMASLQRELNRLQPEQRRVIEELEAQALERGAAVGGGIRRAANRGGRLGIRPLRETAIDVVDEIGVPVPPRAASDFAWAKHDVELPPGRFASLRRDERKAWERAQTAPVASRPAWLVPALHAHGMMAIPRLVTVSTWPLQRRVVGARTQRVIHYAFLASLLRELAHAGDAEPRAGERFQVLLARYGGATPDDITELATQVPRELKRLEAIDRPMREEVAARLEVMPDHVQLWGRPDVLDGAVRDASRRRTMS